MPVRKQSAHSVHHERDDVFWRSGIYDHEHTPTTTEPSRYCTNVADEGQYCKARSREEWIAGVNAIRKSGAPVKDHTTTRCPDGRIALPVRIGRLDPYETVSYRTTAGKDTL